MLDEAESLQKVVREQFIKWAKNTPLILIGITNALVGDAVHGFQHSIPFATYKKAAIMQIIKERLRAACGDDIIFSEFALSIIGSKCESEGGVRIALDLAK
jgi:Cdc6-like AAA superfamily ATPase